MIKLMQQDWAHLLNSIASPELKEMLKSAVTKIEPNKDLIRRQIEHGKDIPGAALA